MQANYEDKPAAHESERALLGSAIIAPDTLREVVVEKWEFDKYYHGELWESLKSLYDQGKAIDLVTLKENLTPDDVVYLTGCAADTPSALNAVTYANNVIQTARQRKMIEIGTQIVKSGYSPNGKDEAHFASLLMENIGLTKTTEQIKGDGLRKYIAERRANPSQVWGIPTGYEDLDNTTGGVHKGRLTLVKGEPGTGKTILVCQAGKNAAAAGFVVDIYEEEMSPDELLMRWVSADTGIQEHRIHQGDLADWELKVIEETIKTIEKLPIRVNTKTGWSAAEIWADQARKKASRHGADLVVIDYLALLRGGKDMKSWDKVEASALENKRMARELNIAVMSVVSVVKDGSIKGTNEVKHAADDVWEIKVDDLDEYIRVITFDKQRFGGMTNENGQVYGKVRLRMSPKLPLLLKTQEYK